MTLEPLNALPGPLVGGTTLPRSRESPSGGARAIKTVVKGKRILCRFFRCPATPVAEITGSVRYYCCTCV